MSRSFCSSTKLQQHVDLLRFFAELSSSHRHCWRNTEKRFARHGWQRILIGGCLSGRNQFIILNFVGFRLTRLFYFTVCSRWHLENNWRSTSYLPERIALQCYITMFEQSVGWKACLHTGMWLERFLVFVSLDSLLLLLAGCSRGPRHRIQRSKTNWKVPLHYCQRVILAVSDFSWPYKAQLIHRVYQPRVSLS